MSAIRNFINRTIYHNDPELLNNPFKKSQNYFILQNLFATAFSLFTGGVFLTGFAIYLGAKDEMIGYITIMPNLCGIFLIFSGFFLERFIEHKKRVVFTLIILSKLIFCLAILIPLFVPKTIQTGVLFVSLIIAFTIQAINVVAMNNWLIKVIPENIRGRYYSIRQSLPLIVTVALPFFTGRLMDLIVNKYNGFLILYGFGLVIMIFELLICLKIQEPKVKQVETNHYRLSDIWHLPLKNKDFMYYVIRLFLIYIVLWISSSFTQVFMLRYLKLSYTLMNLMSIFSALVQLVFYRIWGKISDRRGHYFVMTTCIWFFIGESGFYALFTKTTVFYLMPVAYLFSAIANSGFAISVFNQRYTIVPEKGRTVYDGFYSAAIGLAFIIGPSIGALVKPILAASPLVQKIEFGQFRLLYLVSCIGVIVLQIVDYLRKKKKTWVTKVVIVFHKQ